MPDVSRATPEVERALGPALAKVALSGKPAGTTPRAQKSDVTSQSSTRQTCGQRADLQASFVALAQALGVDGWRVFAARMGRQAVGERERHVQAAWGWAGFAGAELVIYGAPVLRDTERPT